MSELILKLWLACGIVFAASVWAFAGPVYCDVRVVSAYIIMGAVALIAIIWAILAQGERNEARAKRDLYYHQLVETAIAFNIIGVAHG